MIRTIKIYGRATRALLLVALSVLLLVTGCGADKQDDLPQQTNNEPMMEQDMVPEDGSYGAESEAMHPAEMAAVEVKPFSPSPSADSEEEIIEPKHSSNKSSVVRSDQTPAQQLENSYSGVQVEQTGGDYSLMVGSFQKEFNAIDRVKKLQKLGFRPVQEMATIGEQDYYRVHLRGIKSYDEAQNLGSFIKGKLGIDYLVLIR